VAVLDASRPLVIPAQAGIHMSEANAFKHLSSDTQYQTFQRRPSLSQGRQWWSAVL